jgi:hypothetical protein
MILGSGPMSRSSGPAESGTPGRDALLPGRPAERPKAHRPSVPRDGLHASVSFPHVSSGSHWQAVSAHALRAIRVSNGSVPRVAHRPSVLHAGVERCPASRALFDEGGQVCSDRPPSRLGPVHSDIRVPSDSPFHLDVTPLAVAGSRPATDRSVQEASPHLMMPITAPAGPRMKQKSAHETSR